MDECKLIDSEFGPDIYPAVKIMFVWNRGYLHSSSASECTPGVCYCNARCNSKRCGQGDGQCTVVTVCIFGNDAPKRHDTKIIITGAILYQQVHEVYAYMNDLLRKYYEEVFYQEPYVVEIPIIDPSSSDIYIYIYIYI